MASKVDKETKLAALMMQGLMMTPPDELEDFRHKRLGRASEVDLEHIRVVRELLTTLAEALKSDDPALWARVDRAAAALGSMPAVAASVAGAEPDAAPDEAAESEPETEPVEPPASDPSIDKPPPVGTPIDPARMPPSIGPETKAPSPWVSPVEAAAAKAKSEARKSPVPETEPAPPPESPPPPAKVPAAPPLPFDDPPASETQPEGPRRPFVMPFAPVAPVVAGEDLADIRAGKPAMKLSHYAAMCACCAAFPRRVAETHAKFGIAGRERREALDAAWRERFADDARIEQLHQALVSRFEAWLLRYGAL